MKAYAIVDLDIFDIEDYLKYQQAIRPLLQSVNARYLVRGGQFQVIEGSYQPQRIVMVEFPSMEELMDFYHSPQYQALEEQRTACSRATVIAVSGVEDAMSAQD